MISLQLFLLYLLFGREVKVMAVVYATLIVKGLKTLDQVPGIMKAQVEEILVALEIEV